MGQKGGLQKLQQSQALADAQAAIKEMSPQLRQKFKQMQVETIDQMANTVTFVHNLGCQVLEIEENADHYLTEKQKANGIDPLELIRRANATGYETLKKAVQFARVYNKDDLKRLLGYRSKQSEVFRIQWGHIIYLCSIGEAQNRLRFEKEATDNLWTPAELHNAIVRFYGAPRSQGGRKLGIPKTVNKQLEQIAEMSRIWTKRHQEVWHGKGHSVYGNVEQLSDSDINNDTLLRLTTLSQTLEEMQTALHDEASACKRTLAYVQKTIDSRATDSPPAAVAPVDAVAAGRQASRKAKSASTG